MSDLIAFLAARIDEDEATALACLDINERVKIRRGLTPPRWLTSPDSSNITDEAGILRVRHTWTREAAHIARHDPARVLREVEAKRAILKRHVPVVAGYGPLEGQECCAAESSDEDMWYAKPWPCATVCVIVAIWSDHADYRDEWKP